MDTRIKGPRPYGLSVDPDGPVSLPAPPDRAGVFVQVLP